MRFTHFVIENYKGIKHCAIDLSKEIDPAVYSLIGLNESGKTTILEAINFFIAGDRDLQKMYNLQEGDVKKTDFVPKHRKMNFNGTTSVSAGLKLSKDDISAISAWCISKGYEVSGLIDGDITVKQIFKFESSNFVGSERIWDLDIPVVNAKGRKGKVSDLYERDYKAWDGATELLQSRMPQICYFPYFLFDVPEKIYIEPSDEESPTNSYYRRLFQDILDSMDDGLTIEKHIVERIRSSGKREWTWFWFLSTDHKEQVQHVLLKASAKVTRVIMDSWKNVFGRDLENKRIEIEYGYDESIDKIYIRLYLIDGSEKYDIGNRSLGFRWFFCFWLFTRFRVSRKNASGVVFLFDEPASNLHAKAQEELLASLGSLSSGGNVVIYSTHSHYLVNPRWLESSYIIKNGALNYDGIENEFLSGGETDIEAIKYRQFVGSHPKQRNYFLPALDALEYRPSELTLQRASVLVEGKCDFALLDVAWRTKERDFSVVPGNGAPSLDPLIGIMTGWGISFLILLDDDAEGRRAAQRYKRDWGLSGDIVKTIGEFAPSAVGKSMESIIRERHEKDIGDHFQTNSIEKSHVQAYVYEALAGSAKINVDDELHELTDRIYEWSEKALAK